MDLHVDIGILAEPHKNRCLVCVCCFLFCFSNFFYINHEWFRPVSHHIGYQNYFCCTNTNIKIKNLHFESMRSIDCP